MKPDTTNPLNTPPFTVPDHYWDTLTDRIMRRIEEKPAPAPRRNPPPVGPNIGNAARCLRHHGRMRLLVPTRTPASDTLLLSGQDQWEETLSEEEVFDREFNPTHDEIIEYLTEVTDAYELLLATTH